MNSNSLVESVTMSGCDPTLEADKHMAMADQLYDHGRANDDDVRQNYELTCWSCRNFACTRTSDQFVRDNMRHMDRWRMASTLTAAGSTVDQVADATIWECDGSGKGLCGEMSAFFNELLVTTLTAQ